MARINAISCSSLGGSIIGLPLGIVSTSCPAKQTKNQKKSEIWEEETRQQQYDVEYLVRVVHYPATEGCKCCYQNSYCSAEPIAYFIFLHNPHSSFFSSLIGEVIAFSKSKKIIGCICFPKMKLTSSLTNKFEAIEPTNVAVGILSS